MDQSLYKDFTTSRGFVYHYLFSTGDASKSVLLFIHGFPSTSYDWKHQVTFFEEKGYPLIVPDMLGYGGTSKPIDPIHYKHRLLAKDMIEILDAEKVHRTIVIGHNCRMANYYPDRFLAFGFLAVGYYLAFSLSYEVMMQQVKSTLGIDLFGYWDFFSEEGPRDKLDAFCTGDDPELWKHYMGPPGAMKAWVENKKTTAVGSFLTEEDRRVQREELRKGGLAAPVCYYKAVYSTIEADDYQANPPTALKVTKPVFFGGALRDFVALYNVSEAVTKENCEDVTIHVYDTGHWVQMQAKDEVNQDMLTWIQDVEAKTMVS
ncbi:alpha/beta-hydrolase [Desarmillaria tabescens]|uniref:Alpha/beta-hydrolase n=1 Tax=Armillaria tabescens TaxID=1929756 RepID=A0AA39TQH6_ARMTA|nr:alpha/beta-hydrolase [Desarmillaria tabescens]KAK0462988.1 alpha/beta-hydrolase [Desarmillaria tabescens]